MDVTMVQGLGLWFILIAFTMIMLVCANFTVNQQANNIPVPHLLILTGVLLITFG